MTDPRNISPRTDAFLSIIGPYISAIEHQLHSVPFLVKGCDLRSRDVKMSRFLGSHTFVESDYSRFDMTISYDWIKCVQDVILMSYFPGDEVFARALHLASDTFGISDTGLCYKIIGTRCSGDSHTSIGNGLINYFNTWFVLRDVRFDSIHEGDDGLIGLDVDNAQYANRLQLFDCMGFKVKLFVTTDISQASFCGRFLSHTSGGLQSYCDPIRTLSKLHITLSVGDLKELLLAKALSYNYTDGTTPIVGPICQALIELLRPQVKISKAMGRICQDRFILRDMKISDAECMQIKPVDERIRADFGKRSGILPSAQVAFEQHFIQRIRDGSFAYEPIPQDELLWCGMDREIHYMPSVHNVHT